MEALSAPLLSDSAVVGSPASNCPVGAGAANEPRNRVRLILVYDG